MSITLTQWAVVDGNDDILSRWDSLEDAEAAAGEFNAAWLNNNGPAFVADAADYD
jgi:hypothetical protein